MRRDELNSQPNSQVAEKIDEAMIKVNNLCKQAFEDGWSAGYQRGFEFGVGVGLGHTPQYPNTPKLQ